MHPSEIAYQTVHDVMIVGSHKDGNDDSWKDKGADYHLHKAYTHLIKLYAERDGIREPDGENHVKNALTRLAMCLALT